VRRTGRKYRRHGDARLCHRDFSAAAAATVILEVVLEVVLAAFQFGGISAE
jgi:hypothetical protein